MIKKLMLVALTFVMPLCVMAQKIGVVDSKAIFEVMPEKVAAEKVINDLLAQYQAENEKLEKEFNQKYADFQALAPTTAKTIKERRIQEIQDNRQKIVSYQEMVKKDVDAKKAELMDPIKAKLQAAIDSVSTEGAYMLVLDISSTPVAFKRAEVVDITPLVKVNLGIAE
jgi:outer membrane protein